MNSEILDAHCGDNPPSMLSSVQRKSFMWDPFLSRTIVMQQVSINRAGVLGPDLNYLAFWQVHLARKRRLSRRKSSTLIGFLSSPRS